MCVVQYIQCSAVAVRTSEDRLENKKGLRSSLYCECDDYDEREGNGE